jgi:epoxyqueuosine reductase
MKELAERIRLAALAQGLDHVGFTSAAPMQEEGPRLQQWLEKGYHADMSFMQTERLKPEMLLPGASSAIVAGWHYPAPKTTPEPRISAYAAGVDYHIVLREKLENLAGDIRSWMGDGVGLRVFVDTLPILERALGAAAGLGFIGKNSMLINPSRGSFFFIGGILTTLELPQSEPTKVNCGSCDDCLKACPTRAICEPFILDSRRCIGYLTVEHRGVFTQQQRGMIGNSVFGCDACQRACPFNRKALADSRQTQSVEVDLEVALGELADNAFSSLYEGSAIERARRRGLLRNLFAVAINTQAIRSVPVFKRFIGDKDPEVSSMAQEALGKISIK